MILDNQDMRNQTKKAIVSILKEFDVLFLFSVILLCIAIIHFDNETDENTYMIEGVISDVELSGLGRADLIAFKINDVDCYYLVADSKRDNKNVVFNNYKKLETSGKKITAIVTEDKKIFMDSKFNLHIVGIVGETENCFSLSSHNARQTFGRILFIVISLPGFLFTLTSQYKILLNEIVYPMRKRKRQSIRKQK